MFNILVVEPNGNERLREDALEVRRINAPVMRDPVTDGGEPVATGRGALIRWSDGIDTHFAEAQTSDQASVIYVMNRFGATVATYRL